MKIEQKTIALKNVYTGDIVYTDAYDDVTKAGDMEFIRVFDTRNRYRTYLANRAAFVIVKDKQDK